MKKQMLIVTSKDDVHSDAVIRHLQNIGKGDDVVRLNTEDIATNASVSFDGTDANIQLHDSGRTFNSSQIRSVWFRRPKPINVLDRDYSSSVQTFISDEWTAFIRGVYFCMHDSSLWVNPLPSLHRARNKLQQLQLAINLGFAVPNTLVSNNPEAIARFHDQNDLVCMKTLEKPSYQLAPGEYIPIYTRLVTRTECVSNQASLSVSPVLFQQFIEKIFDVRVIVIGNEIRAFSITPKAGSLAEKDFRHGFSEGMAYEEIALPNDISDKIKEFVYAQGLVFSAIDMVVDSSERMWFLENNANGQWLWLEHATDAPLSAIMAHLLSEGE